MDRIFSRMLEDHITAIETGRSCNMPLSFGEHYPYGIVAKREKAMGQRQTASTNDPSFQVSGQGVQGCPGGFGAIKALRCFL